MSKFNVLAIAAVAIIGLSACSSSDDEMYLGSRDDIIINNKNMLKETATESESKEKAKIEMAKDETESQNGTTEAERATLEAAAEVNNTVAPAAVANADGNVEGTAPAPVTTQTVAATPPAPAGSSDIPPNAKPGECYAKVLIPAVTQTKTDRVLIAEEQKVLNRIIPAKYRVETERVLVKEARQYWKAGQGPITKKDEVTGEIMCLVEEPAQYKTVEKRILVEEEKPEYKMIPAQYETVSKTETIQPERWEWRRILCETNMGADSIIRIQQALHAKGYNIAIDGRLGNATMDALSKYQTKNGLATRGITYETLEHLGVRLIGA